LQRRKRGEEWRKRREGRTPLKQILAYGFAMNEMHMHDMALPYTYYMFT